jgi:hypothetical protein
MKTPFGNDNYQHGDWYFCPICRKGGYQSVDGYAVWKPAHDTFYLVHPACKVDR